MKALRNFTIAASAAFAFGTAGASGLNSVLDGMFTNVSAPDVVSNQFRGTIAGGGVYVRSPLTNIQVISLDPPRLSIGCGGIDLYLGAFSFISAEKLTQFIRTTAQNAAPLAFKMALDASFPQLGGVLDKFQHMAQMMNDAQRNSCQIAQKIVDPLKSSMGENTQMMQSITAGVSTLEGWVSDFTAQMEEFTSLPSKNVARASEKTKADGTHAIKTLGNLTWRALEERKSQGFVYGITDDPVMAQQVLMTLIGTTLREAGPSEEDEPVVKPFNPLVLPLKHLFNPPIGSNGERGVVVWSCGGDTKDCKNPVATQLNTNGVAGFVRKQMLGTETATSAQPGSIVYNMMHCTADNCGMTTAQMRYLNSLGKIPAVGMLIRAQRAPGVINMISGDLIDAMANEVSIAYGNAVLNLAVSVYSKTDLPQPAGFDNTIKTMREDISEVELASKATLSRLNTMASYIDAAIRSNGKIVNYRPQ